MKRLSIVGLILGFAIILTIGATLIGNSRVQGAQTSHPIGFTPPLHPKSAGHFRAIQPDAAMMAAHSATTFTSTDVEAYLKTDSFLGQNTNLTHTITFMSSQDLSKQLDQDFSQDSSMLCYVEYWGNGPFTLDTVRVAPGAKTPHFSKAFEVFDGQTGDLLVWGATP